MSVELSFTGKCRGCGCAELELIEVPAYLGKILWRVQCRHDKACSRMEELNGRDETDDTCQGHPGQMSGLLL